MPPTSPPAASQGRSTVLHQPRSARTAAAKQLRTSHRGAAALLSAAAAAGQPGPRRAPRPVSPGTAALAADARGARRPTDALNELRPLRQRVSRARAFAYPLPPLAASALWPAVAGSLQPDAAGRGVAPPRRHPAINALDEPRAARWRSARGQREACAEFCADLFPSA